MTVQLIHFFTLLLLMLVTGVFWGPWLSLHRSMKSFNAEEFIKIVKIMAANLAMPMRLIMPSCILLMLLSVFIYPEKNSIGFYLTIIAFSLSLLSLIITLSVEVPIVKQIQEWKTETLPSTWETIRERWLKFHVIRTFASILSFAAYTASILLLH